MPRLRRKSQRRKPFADPDTGTTLVLEKSFAFPDGEVLPNAPNLVDRRIGPHTVGVLARGQVISKAARRRANRELVLGGTKAQTSVLPHRGAWDRLGAPLRIERQAELDALWAGRPPGLLRPPLLAEGLHVFDVAKVGLHGYLPGSQRLLASMKDGSGAAYILERAHRGVAPHALGHLARALEEPVRFVVGWPKRHAGGWSIEVLALAGERMVIPDLEPGIAGFEVEVIGEPEQAGLVAELLEATWSSLAALLHPGLGSPPPSRVDALAALASRCTDAGLRAVAARLHALREAIPGSGAAERWMDAAIRVALSKSAA